MVVRSAHQALDGRAPERAAAVVQALSDFGAPLSAIAPYVSARPFLESLSGIDRLRVMRAARDSHGAYAWWSK